MMQFMSAIVLGAIVASSSACGFGQKPTIQFLDKTYRLASFNQKHKPMWEFVTGNETVDNWTTLMTVIDRPDSLTRQDLDRLAEGIMQSYKSSGGKILLARTMQDAKGAPFNYMVSAFDQPQKHQMELNFVKVAQGPKNAYMVIHGVRIADPQDYTTKARDFLNQHSSEIGQALEKSSPDINSLPRKEF